MSQDKHVGIQNYDEKVYENARALKATDLVNSCQTCSKDCPWTGESYGVDMGCLPTPAEMVTFARERGEILSCHNDLTTPCKPLAKYLHRNGIDVTQLKLVENR